MYQFIAFLVLAQNFHKLHAYNVLNPCKQ